MQAISYQTYIIIVSCDSIIDFLANSYFIVEIHHAKSFKIKYCILLIFDPLKLMRLKLQPREVPKVAKVQVKKCLIKNSHICFFFELRKHYAPQKKAENNVHSGLKLN